MDRAVGQWQPIITVVMPTLNQVRFLEESLLSVFDQRYPHTELIVIDGGSTDETLDILRAYDSQIAYWESMPDRGQSHALNKGFDRATGDVLCWLNSDDILLPATFATVLEAFRTNVNAQVVYGDWVNIDADSVVLRRDFAFDMSVGQMVYEGFCSNAQAMFWRREVHVRFGAFTETLHRTMDYDMMLRFALNEPRQSFVRVDVPLAGFRRYDGQKTSGWDTAVAEEHLAIAQRLGFRWKGTPLGRALRSVYRVRRAYWYWRRGGWGYFVDKLAESAGFCARGGM